MDCYTKLNNFINNSDDIYINILDDYELFDFDDYTDFKLVLTFLLENVYNKSLKKESKERLDQNSFSKVIKDKYKKCIITDSIAEECEAAHIVDVCDGGLYNINNGILLNSAIHKTFDLYLWTINPDTLKIEVKENHNGTIKKYEGIKVDIKLNPSLYSNLCIRYKKFNNQFY